MVLRRTRSEQRQGKQREGKLVKAWWWMPKWSRRLRDVHCCQGQKTHEAVRAFQTLMLRAPSEDTKDNSKAIKSQHMHWELWQPIYFIFIPTSSEYVNIPQGGHFFLQQSPALVTLTYTQRPRHGTVAVLIGPTSLGATAQLSKRGICFISLCSWEGTQAALHWSSGPAGDCTPVRQVDQDSWALSSQEGKSSFWDALQGLLRKTWNNSPSYMLKLGRDEREWFGTQKTFSHLDPIQISDISPLELQKNEPTCSTCKVLVASTLIYGRPTHLHSSRIQISAQPGTAWLLNQRN